MKIARRHFALGSALLACKSEQAAPQAPKLPESRAVLRVLSAQPSVDGAGVHLARLIGGRVLPMADPFLLLDEIHSPDPSDWSAGFPRHPHRGFETVTIMLEGAIEHQDSIGNRGRLTGGSIQWMTAGHGIIHSEMPKADGGPFWGLQLWVNLPRSLKLTKPRYQDIAADRVPEVGKVKTRVLAGTHEGVRGPVDGVFTAPMLLDVTLAGDSFVHELPTDHTAVAYVLDGSVLVGSEKTAIGARSIAQLGKGSTIAMQGTGRVLLIAAAPINEPVARRGPFVMNTEEELDRAFDDYETGRLTET